MSRIHKAKSVDGISSNFIIFRNCLEPDLIFLQNSINYAGVLSIEPKHLEILADSQTDRPSKLSRPAEAVLLNICWIPQSTENTSENEQTSKCKAPSRSIYWLLLPSTSEK